MRDILADRLCGGGLAALLAWFLVLQGLIGAVGLGMAQAGPAGGLAVICTPAGLAGSGEAPDGPAPPPHACCLALCQALGGLTPALPAAAAATGPCPDTGTCGFAAVAGRERPAGPAIRLAEARAPPRFA